MAGNTGTVTSVNSGHFHGPQFTKVRDGRKHPIRGLWVRNGRFYGRLTVEDTNTSEKSVRRVPLMDKDNKPVQTVAQAVEALNRLKVNRSDDNLPVLSRTPKFSEYVKTYIGFISAGQGQKKPKTIKKEEYALKGWMGRIGSLRLDKIRRAHVNAYIKDRLDGGVSPRTVNLDVGALRNVLNHGIAENWLKVLPTLNLRPLKTSTPKRGLFTVADLETLCKAAADRNEDGSLVTKNAQQFCDYIRLLAYCGGREQETLALRWDTDVDFKREQLTIGRDGDTKNGKGRVVDFNPKLKAHLKAMHKRRVPDSEWLFPSPQRGKKDIHAQSFRESLKLVREHAAKKNPEMAHKAFHDLRHHFISYCVMSGIDFMTIAEWVGHSDGGILIGKVYGHLADHHKKQQAAKLNFGPVVLEASA